MRFHATSALAGGLFALTVMPAAAQVAACGPDVPVGQWIGGAADTSDIATHGAAFDLAGASVPPGGYAVSNFTVSSPATVRVEARGQFGGDPLIQLYDQSGILIVTDDDSGGNWNSRAEVQLDPGTYCLATRSYGGGPIAADIRVGLTEHPALTQGSGGSNILACTADTPATPLGQGPLDQIAGQEAEATNSVNEAPYYRFTLSSQMPVSIRAENPSADPYIYIYDAAGQLLGENDDYNSLDSRVDFPDGLAAGSYCIGMRALNNPELPVRVSVQSYSEADMMLDLYANGEASPPPDGSAYPVVPLGTLQTQLVNDGAVGPEARWLRFDVAEAGLVVINAVGIGQSDPMIALFDTVGREVAFNDDANNSLDSQISAQVSAGTYMLGVMQYHGQNGAIRVTLQRYIPAR
ncbi:DVUA0089 family protein [Nioella nitratireducens]|uniref:DVUA0089 family protein n=1 Tax=Nioella nitratireducens TaxID=1287720 RepID=UPI0008FD1BBA|nr:DVUA0089 family protein [Nioella nitratireducens]